MSVIFVFTGGKKASKTNFSRPGSFFLHLLFSGAAGIGNRSGGW
jgi:hypothetical protein